LPIEKGSALAELPDKLPKTENSESRIRLIETLEALGVEDDPYCEVLFESPPELERMGAIYQHVNDYLEHALDDGRSLRIQHITGEARALLDPAQRRVVRRADALADTPQLGCYFDAPGQPTAWDFVQHGVEYWQSAAWFDLVDSFFLASEGIVEIFVLAKPANVHFSLFSDDLLLLQDEHTHPQTQKRVWFIRSASLVGQLQPRVEEMFSTARRIRRESFSSILDWLYDYDTVSLVEQAAAGEKGLDITSLGEDAREDISRLTAMFFLRPTSRTTFTVTTRSQQWLSKLLGDSSRATQDIPG
jgi:hypothetical protein